MCYYERNPNSPFFAYMQDTSVEQKMTAEQKEKRRIDATNTIVIWGLEGMEFTTDEQNYLIYAFINDIDPDVACEILLKYAE